MRLVTVAAATLNQTPLDWAGNLARVRLAIAEARKAGAGVLCLPELCLTGYGCEDMFNAPYVHEAAAEGLHTLLSETKGMIVAVGLPVLHQHAVFNTVAIVAHGRILGLVAKRFLAGDGVHYEPRWFKPWPGGVVGSLRMRGNEYPIGDLVFEVAGIRLGLEICEDAWVASRPGGQLAALGVDLILNPSASHFAFGKIDVRRRFVLEGSRAFCTAYVYANLCGNEAGRVIYDGGALIAACGQPLAEGPRFSFAEVSVTTATIDLDLIRSGHSRIASYSPRLESGARIVVADAVDVLSGDGRLDTGLEKVRPWTKEEEFTRAVALALFDYLRKSRSRGFVVSLSGGADSTAVVLLVRLMLDLALAELGAEEMRRRLPFLPALGAAEDATAAWMPHLLHTVYQATVNSSETTENAARTIAEAIGATYARIDVDAIVHQYRGTVEAMLGRDLSWETDDIALQNIQARVRAPSVWMLANIHGALLLSTSNRSEAAVGYATMDGDTCGGLCPIAGIDKAFLRQWLRWIETTGTEDIAPIPAAGVVNKLTPTAELRPSAAAQTDEEDLMPYPVLDFIERCAIRDKRGPFEVLALLEQTYPDFTDEQRRQWTRRFFTLWSRNQWKRERYAPSFHLDDENLDPKSWCRFPILSSGFEEELSKL
ncbi:MAG: NAD(+) synthase [Opitutales bacterium]